LSIPERIQLVEEIWDTIATEAEAVELTEDEKRIIDERLEVYHKNPDSGFPWEDVYKRIRAPFCHSEGAKRLKNLWLHCSWNRNSGGCRNRRFFTPFRMTNWRERFKLCHKIALLSAMPANLNK